MKINLGGSKSESKGMVSVDLHRDADVKHDLNVLPYPFKDNSAEEIYTSCTLEHLEITEGEFYKECYRILKPYGIIVHIFPNSFYINYRIQYILGRIPNYFIPGHKKIISFENQVIQMWNAGFKPMMRKWHFYPFKMLKSHFKLIGKKAL